MNSFLNLHSSEDYRNINRPYYTGTWEYINIASDQLIPFQYVSTASDALIYIINPDGDEYDMSTMFRTSSKIVSWTYSGTGTHSSSGPTLVTWEPDLDDYWLSNNFTCTAGLSIKVKIDPAEFETRAQVVVQLRKGTTVLTSYTAAAGNNGLIYYDITETASNYNVKILNDSFVPLVMVSSNVPTARQSSIHKNGNYWHYDGSVLDTSFASALPAGYEICRLRVNGSSTYYGDWMDQSGFTGKTKISISSSYDFGGIKYVGGYTQWMYKSATVRRAPKAEIEITGDKLNGTIIEEKKVTAVRYKITMKCTEAEYEALVHAMGGTLTITDPTGMVFNAVNIELSDPTWYRSNGIIELSFVDSNNINIYTMNNSAL